MSLAGASLAALLAALLTFGVTARALEPTRRPSTHQHTAGGRARRLRGAIAAPNRELARRRRRRRGVSADAVAWWCAAVARRVRSGSTLREATGAEIPPDPLLAELTEPLRRGIERGGSLASLARGLPIDRVGETSHPPGSHHLRLACSVIASVSELGGSAAAPLDRVAAAMRLRTADAQERRAHSAQARLSAHVLTVVPLAILGLLAGTDPDVRTTLSSAGGATSLALGLLLNLGGWIWMRRIIGAGA